MSANEDVVVDFTGKVLSEDDIKQCIEELRKLILEDNKSRKIRVDEDAYLLRFLYCTNFDVPLAFKRVQDFHNFIMENLDWFPATSPVAKKKQLQRNSKAILKFKDRKGRSVYLTRAGKMDVQNGSPQDEAQIDELWYEAVLNDPQAQANGISVLMDMKGYSWKLFKWLTPANLKIASKMTDLFPCKELIFHVVNTSFWVNAGIKMSWPFMSEGTKQRMRFHFEDMSSLHQHFSPDVLPPEFGGTGPEIEFDKLNEWFLDQDSDLRKKLEYRSRNSK